MITHLVLLKFNPQVTEENILALEQGLDALPDAIQEIISYEFGRGIMKSDRSYDFGLSSLFANLETLKRYQQHPRHLEVLAIIQAMCSHIVTVDFELSPPDDFRLERTAVGSG